MRRLSHLEEVIMDKQYYKSKHHAYHNHPETDILKMVGRITGELIQLGETRR